MKEIVSRTEIYKNIHTYTRIIPDRNVNVLFEELKEIGHESLLLNIKP